MELQDLKELELAQKAKDMAECIQRGCMEDAYYHCLDLLYSLHRRVLSKNAKYAEAFASIRKVSG